MNVLSQCIGHLSTTNIRYSMKSEAIVHFVVGLQILPDGVDDEAKEVRVLVHEERHGQVSLQTRPLSKAREKSGYGALSVSRCTWDLI